MNKTRVDVALATLGAAKLVLLERARVAHGAVLDARHWPWGFETCHAATCVNARNTAELMVKAVDVIKQEVLLPEPESMHSHEWGEPHESRNHRGSWYVNCGGAKCTAWQTVTVQVAAGGEIHY